MHIVRYQRNDRIQWGHLDGDRVGPITGDIYGEFSREPAQWTLDKVKLLAPCQPSKILALGPNFPDRVRELQDPTPALPLVYFKAPTAIISPGEAIALPPQSQRVEHGVELAVVIGKRAHRVSPDTALNYVLGYTCANDVIAFDIALQDGAWTRGNSFDTFGPLGPAIATGLDPTELQLTCAVNGVTRQLSSTHDLIFGVPQVIAFISAAMTLLPGDVILMGSPGGASPLTEGDVVEVEIEGVGKLSNPVKRET
jgi:2-keto-4-pentenoate hydratase/2-oxohepta-3-ene-1,7-dioic acid hydratase in catechol pathway